MLVLVWEGHDASAIDPPPVTSHRSSTGVREIYLSGSDSDSLLSGTYLAVEIGTVVAGVQRQLLAYCHQYHR